MFIGPIIPKKKWDCSFYFKRNAILSRHNYILFCKDNKEYLDFSVCKFMLYDIKIVEFL
jgi:hypothetical protein